MAGIYLTFLLVVPLVTLQSTIEMSPDLEKNWIPTRPSSISNPGAL